MRETGFSVDEAIVRRQLERIFQSPEFSSSKRCQEFLPHIVEKHVRVISESPGSATVIARHVW